ncbi:hypothetical protein PoB_001640300 [Plakobranchus ocellatus]|uniref:Uncharacterized protein n=1 Tax=Plakobranchus ocellatus TaxID=259542 RepID=A0AAV3Z5B6_9GAST|nr:hypothetical protein PoB_001640300 [Plakobranchus ocellatus]
MYNASEICSFIQNGYSSPHQGDLRLPGPPSGQGTGGVARTRDRRIPVDIRADSLATVPSNPPNAGEDKNLWWEKEKYID